MTLTSSWVHNGQEITVTTNQLPDESPDDFMQRHLDAVATMKAKFPPNE